MLLSTDIINNIDQIVEKSYLDFTFLLIGDRFFTTDQKRQIESLGLIIGRKPLIELLYILVRNRPTEGYRKDATLNQLLDEIAISGVLPIINDTQQASVDHAKATLNETIENTKQEIKTKVSQEILKVNNEYKNDIALTRIDSVPNLEEKTSKYTNKVLAAVTGLVVASQAKFLKGFTTSMTDTVNNGVVDSMVQEATEEGKKLKDVECFKIVNKDAKLCRWCNSFYNNDDGTPKIYKLKQLQANGTNLGKPKEAWRPVVGPTHHNCRCELRYKK